MRSCAAASVTRPSVSNTLLAPEIRTRPSNHGRIPNVRSTGNHAVCANAVPPGPGVAPMGATGRPRNTRPMVHQAIDGGRRRHLIATYPIPLREYPFARNQDRASLVAFGEQREQNLGLLGALLDVAHVVEEQDRERIEFPQGAAATRDSVSRRAAPGP